MMWSDLRIWSHKGDCDQTNSQDRSDSACCTWDLHERQRANAWVGWSQVLPGDPHFEIAEGNNAQRWLGCESCDWIFGFEWQRWYACMYGWLICCGDSNRWCMIVMVKWKADQTNPWNKIKHCKPHQVYLRHTHHHISHEPLDLS